MKLKANTWYEFSINVRFNKDTEVPVTGLAVAGGPLEMLKYVVERWRNPGYEQGAMYLDNPVVKEYSHGQL